MSGLGMKSKSGIMARLLSVIRTFNYDCLLSHLP